MKSFSKKLILLLLTTLTAVSGSAQETVSGPLSLQECIDYALQHNASVKNERVNIAISKAQIGETMAEGLPQISASGGITNNIKIPVTFMDASNFRDDLPKGTFMPVEFGVPWQGSASVNASQLIFDGSYFVGLQAAKVYKQLAEKGVRRAEIDVVEGVSLAYFGALVAEERLALLQNNLQRLDSLHHETQAMYQNGFAEAIDVQRVRVNLNNVRTQYDNVSRSLAVNLNALKFQMGMRIDREISLAEGIADFNLTGTLDERAETAGGKADFGYSNRIEYQQLQVNKELSRLNIKNNKIQYLPTLSAFANVGYNAGKPNFGGLFEETPDIHMTDPETQQPTILNASTWNPYVTVGLNLNIPVFDGLLKANRIRRTKLELEQVENQILNLENSIDMEINQSYTNLQNSIASLAAQQENRELAQEVFRVTKIKFQQGVGSNLEVIEAENAFKEAETNYFNALYEALVAKTSYQKATGTLYKK